MKLSSCYARYGRWIRGLVVCALPVLLWGAKGAFESNRNDLLDWLPDGFVETQRLYWFVERFGSDEILVVSWDGCTLDDPRLDEVAAKLVETVKHPQSGVSGRWFDRVFTGRQSLMEMTSAPLELTEDEARRRLRGWLVGPDGRTTCAVALISPGGTLDRPGAVRFVNQVVTSVGILPTQIHIGGPTVDGVAVDQASNQWIIEMAVCSSLVGLLVAWRSLGQWRSALIAFATALVAWAMSLSLVYYQGVNMDAVLMMMPSLVFVLAVSGSVHLTNYYLDTPGQPTASEATLGAIRRGWLPCVLASVTTAIGLASLMASQVVPVRKFGLYASLGVLLNVIALLLIWPSLVERWPLRRDAHSVNRPAAKPRPWWQPLFRSADRHATPCLLIVALSLPLLAYGATQLKTSAQLQDLLSPDSPTMQDYAWLQEHLGSLVPVEVVLRFDRGENEDAKTMLQRAQLVEQLRRRLAQQANVGSAIAATTFAPTLPDVGGARQVMLRRLLATNLRKYRDQFVQLRFLYDEHDQELWRISTRVPSTHVDYGQLLQRLDAEIRDFLGREGRAADNQVSAEVCGGVPVLYIAQQQLLKDLVKSFLAAFVLIGVTMVLLLRSLRAGLLSMIPNVFPALLAFGTMGLLGTSVDIGTMMTASAAMGIAVDDTLHFLVWFRRGIERGLPRTDAVRFGFQHCATPMLQTSIICALGLLVFVVSPFGPICRFGGVMAILLGLALLGDLWVLPALLCSPLGRCFVSRPIDVDAPSPPS